MRVCPSCTRLLATDTCPEDGTAAAAVEALPEGTRVGPYSVIAPIGRGGMGHVYEAVHTELERRVAIKFLRDELGDDELPARFLREARAVSRIDHDNVIKVYDYGDGSGGAVFFVMEMLDGETLWDLNRRCGRLDPALCHHIYDQILEALEAAHRRDVIHRDLKPTNVFIVERESNPRFVKLLDFGLARLAGDREGPRLTLEGTIMGTPEYMSPEQLEGKTADARSDMYAVGVMLYESLTGRVPFPAAGNSFPALARMVLLEPPEPPSAVAPISSALERLILKALAKAPGDRFASIAEMRAAFAAAARDFVERGQQAPTKSGNKNIGEEPEPPTTPGQAPREAIESALTIPSATGVEPVGSVPAARGRSPWLAVGLVAVLVAALAATLAIASRDDAAATDTAGEPPAIDAGPPTVERLWAAGDRDGARALARRSVEADLGSGDLELAGATGRGVIAAASPTAAPLLYRALEGPPEVRGGAAAAIAELRLFDGAPRIRAVLDRSGERLRVRLAAALLELGDRSALGLLEAALGSGEPERALVAAEALAGDAALGEKARARLAAIAAETPPARPRWLRATAALAAAGDANAREALAALLAQPDAGRAVRAAAVLAPYDAAAAGYLERVVSDPGFAARPAAALALAHLGRASALEPVPALLDGGGYEALAAIGAAARLGKRGGERYADRIARLAVAGSPEVSAAARVALLAF